MPAARFKSSRARNATLVLAVVAALHFALSSLLWSFLLLAAVRQDWDLPRVLLGATPAFLLLGWFAFVSLAALRRLRVAAALLVAGLVAGGAVFAYDAVTRNYQMHAENYHGRGGGKTFHYSTWWWYDEGWFRK